MLKFSSTFFLILLVSFANAQKLDSFEVSGTVVSLNSNEPIPFATIMLTRTQGYMSDSAGNFKIKNLGKGQHILHFSAAGFQQKDTTVFISENDINNFKLFVQTDCTGTPHFNLERAQQDIEAGKPKLLLIGSIAPMHYKSQDKFEKKYKVYYFDFGCTPDFNECILEYNRMVFAYLDKKYGNKWRKEARTDIIGFKSN